ncbi:GAF domain-containing protein [Chitinophaga sedimenti]|uniref:GAF domain-containing protein n=1 Tax=Chitinophaga sedimenti TaxID=2033606 RepID=UPI0020045805|nr:GAF domain-containing protein [Chitinophaga sedimenti]MCK7555789.1 GAF domain-containing protein [Chitinophaga sedimenti]
MNEEIETNLAAEVASVQEIDIIPAILEIVCKATGLRFSAVARVTEDRWIACAVRDEIAFGLLPGGELEIRSTICNEIRDHGQPVVIDNVSEDADFCNHHTPKQYGFQSYISIPIFRKNGAFFGTLCALDPLPMPLKSTKMETLFTLFADLISYHTDTQDRVRQKNAMLQIVQHKLDDSLDDIRQLNKISNHALQEPLRKLMFYSDMLLTDQSASEETRQFARKINSLANNFATMIRELAHYSMLGGTITDFNSVDLNTVLAAALHRLQPNIQAKKAIIYTDVLPTVPGIAPQLNQLFTT